MEPLLDLGDELGTSLSRETAAEIEVIKVEYCGDKDGQGRPTQTDRYRVEIKTDASGDPISVSPFMSRDDANALRRKIESKIREFLVQ
jgi:hypothetical protein